MDIAALGAASQLQSGQRTQQAGIAGLKSAQVQAQSLVALLTKATDQAKQVQTPEVQTGAAAAPANQPAPEQSASERRLARGSIVNILA